MADKAARETALEEEQRKNRLAKELEIARLRAAQERMADLKSHQDELKALRTQDEVLIQSWLMFMMLQILIEK